MPKHESVGKKTSLTEEGGFAETQGKKKKKVYDL